MKIYSIRCVPFMLLLVIAAAVMAEQPNPKPAKDAKPIKVFILAGDEYVLENGFVDGTTDGKHDDFFPNAKPTKGEQRKHLNASVYATAYAPEIDFAKLEPVATSMVEVGYQRTRRANAKERGRVNVPMAPFPDEAFQLGHTTVMRGYVTVPFKGRYMFHPGQQQSAFNVTTVDGKTVYRRDVGEEKGTYQTLELEPKKRYALETVFFDKPGHAFQVQLVNKPGTLSTAIDENPKYAFLRDDFMNYVSRPDVKLYDAHSIYNNTEAPAERVDIAAKPTGGGLKSEVMGVTATLSHRLGEALDEPVLIIRYGTRHPIWFRRGSRDLSHHFRPPSSGGGSDLEGSFDVIHFNHGVWDAMYRDESSRFFSGVNTTSVEDFEKNLRTLVKRMKKTGATLIWASVTPVWEGEPGKPNADEDAYNRVAAKVMKEHGVIINDLNAETLRQGAGTGTNVHNVGNLTPKVTETIRAALAERKNPTKPLPRVLFIGDSITGTYWAGVQRELDGEAVVFKNPGNAEDTWNGLERIDEWLDLETYLLNGQDYLELVDGVRKVLGPELERAYPGDAGQGVDLAGVFWFQGEADGAWPSKAKAYEEHLANLIRDLRKDFNKPNLPVVVTTLAKAGGTMTPNQQLVFDAQMAVGDATKYPEFAENVISIDTRPMCRPADESPGGRDRYLGNAETYLEIGDAMADSMLELMK